MVIRQIKLIDIAIIKILWLLGCLNSPTSVCRNYRVQGHPTGTETQNLMQCALIRIIIYIL
jgi:hypothetical protein